MAGVKTKLVVANSNDGDDLDTLINEFIADKGINKGSLIDIKFTSTKGSSSTMYDKALVIYESTNYSKEG